MFDREEELRRKSAQIFIAIEKAIGENLLNLLPEFKLPEPVRSLVSGQDNLSHVKREDISEMYLSDMMDVLCESLETTVLGKPATRLRRRMVDNKFYDIRNRICHPMNEFGEHDYYIVASIAASPEIGELSYKTVIAALRAAEDNRFDLVLDDWINFKLSTEIENNLDEVIGDDNYSIFIGRDSQLKSLKQYLRSRRANLISVSGPGGTGKTALVMNLLRSIRFDQSFKKEITHIIFKTAKQRTLSYTGLHSQSSDFCTIEDLEVALAETFAGDTFDECITELVEENVLICIDNLETLITNGLDKEEAFYSWIDKLPPNWKIIVTSRVGIKSQWNIDATTLTEADKKQIFYAYAERKSVVISEDQYASYSKKLNTPLVIRLCVDGLASGGQNFSDVLEKASELTDEFCFKECIEMLNPDACMIIECFFAIQTNLSKTEIAYLCNLSEKIDRITKALQELDSYSFITLVDGKYKLSESIQAYVRNNPLNMEAREVARELYQKLDSKNSEITDKFAFDYISGDYSKVNNNHLITAATKLRKSIGDRPKSKKRRFVPTGNQEGIKEVFSQLESLENALSHSSDYWRIKAKALMQMFDTALAFECIDKALSINPNEIASLVLSADLYSKDQRYEEAMQVCNRVLELEQVVPNTHVGNSFAFHYATSFQRYASDLSVEAKELNKSGHSIDATRLSKKSKTIFEHCISTIDSPAFETIDMHTYKIGCYRRIVEHYPNVINGTFDEIKALRKTHLQDRMHYLQRALNILIELGLPRGGDIKESVSVLNELSFTWHSYFRKLKLEDGSIDKKENQWYLDRRYDKTYWGPVIMYAYNHLSNMWRNDRRPFSDTKDIYLPTWCNISTISIPGLSNPLSLGGLPEDLIRYNGGLDMVRTTVCSSITEGDMAVSLKDNDGNIYSMHLSAWMRNQKLFKNLVVGSIVFVVPAINHFIAPRKLANKSIVDKAVAVEEVCKESTSEINVLLGTTEEQFNDFNTLE